MTLRILGGRWKGRTLRSPPSHLTRPTQAIMRQAVFNICQHFIEGARFLDLFAGSGAMGLEALSRGAAEVVFIENTRQAVRCIYSNIDLLKVDSCVQVLSMDAAKAISCLGTMNRSFDIIYIDPPYEQSKTVPSLLIEIKKHRLVSESTTIFIENAAHTAPIDHAPYLSCISTRRFGAACLCQYCVLNLKAKP
jgi:16S rRNA (guanine966-N2)-methyltransferase